MAVVKEENGDSDLSSPPVSEALVSEASSPLSSLEEEEEGGSTESDASPDVDTFNAKEPSSGGSEDISG